MKDKIMELLNNLQENELRDLFNYYCEENSYGETIVDMSEFEEWTGCNDKPFRDTFDSLDDGFSFNHNYFVEQDNGYYKSFDNISDFLEECYLSDLANWIIRHGDDSNFPSELNELLEANEDYPSSSPIIQLEYSSSGHVGISSVSNKGYNVQLINKRRECKMTYKVTTIFYNNGKVNQL